MLTQRHTDTHMHTHMHIDTYTHEPFFTQWLFKCCFFGLLDINSKSLLCREHMTNPLSTRQNGDSDCDRWCLHNRTMDCRIQGQLISYFWQRGKCPVLQTLNSVSDFKGNIQCPNKICCSRIFHYMWGLEQPLDENHPLSVEKWCPGLDWNCGSQWKSWDPGMARIHFLWTC